MKHSLSSSRAARGLGLAAAGLLALSWACSEAEPTVATAGASAAPAAAAHAGSDSCAECHADAYESWRDSHHALAERALDEERDAPSFEPEREVAHGTQTTRVRRGEAGFELVAAGADGELRSFPVDGVFGVAPLVQYLVPTGDGRKQVTELAWDPERGEWFDVYGEEDRRPGEWGHWTGRGMSWNSQCAACHNTAYREHWNAETDGYDWTRAERGVGCEACHGPLADHAGAAEANAAPAIGRPAAWTEARGAVAAAARASGVHGPEARASVEACGTCHARATPLTDGYLPGEAYDDHYLLGVPDSDDTYYADGQVQGENFEYTAFLQSRMYHEGVRCTDCHDPHSGDTWLAGDALCLGCHETRPAFREHANHPASAGVGCADCHMPLTTYMQRHPRRDHGFHVPDPRMTRELGIPNACDRCHAEEGAAWAEEAMNDWFGAELLEERLGEKRGRTRAVTAARAGDPAAIAPLAVAAREEDAAVWRASALILLTPFAGDPRAREAAMGAARDPEALVRASAARVLGRLAAWGDSDSARLLAELLEDPRRAVRVEATRGLRPALDPDAPEAADLRAALERDADQPTGAAELGAWYFERGRMAEAARLMERALGWDASAVYVRHALAQCYSLEGRTEDAVRELERAVTDAPDDAELSYALGLALHEAGRDRAAASRLVDATVRNPEHVRAWFNLGLLLPRIEQLDAGLEALGRAAALEPESPEAPWAAATLLLEAGRTGQAAAAAREALSRDPRHENARALLRQLATRPPEAPPR